MYQLRVRLPEERIPHRRLAQGCELEGVVVVGEGYAPGAAQLPPAVEAVREPRDRFLAAAFRRDYRDYSVGAAQGVHVEDHPLGVGLPGVEGYVGAGGAQAEVVEDRVDVLGGEAAVPGELDGGVADLGEVPQGGGHVASCVLADGVELERYLVFSHAIPSWSATPRGAAFIVRRLDRSGGLPEQVLRGQWGGSLEGALYVHVPALLLRRLEGVHDLEYVVAEFAARPVRSTVAQRAGEVYQADATAVLRVVVGQGHVRPFVRTGAPQPYGAAEGVGVGHPNRAFRAIDLDARYVFRPHVEAGEDGAHTAVLEVHHPRDVGRGVHLNLCSVLELAGDHPLGEANPGRARDAAHGSDERRKRGEVVGAHIEHGACAVLVEESGVRVPILGPVAQHVGRRGDGFADSALVDKLAARLQATAEEGVGGTSEP